MPNRREEEAVFEKIFHQLIKQSMEKYKISKDQAEKRVSMLIKSGLLAQNTNDPRVQAQIDHFLSIQI